MVGLIQQRGGVHFTDPKQFMAARSASTAYHNYDSGSTYRAGNTTNFFTEMARRGIQDQTDWTADTYKTIVNLSGGGFMFCYIGPTAGGSSTHTVELTVDGGTAVEIAIGSMASGERASLLASYSVNGEYTVADANLKPGGETLDSAKQQFAAIHGGSIIPMWSYVLQIGTPLLRFNSSLLVRAKHSASITNSTATAYSALMYRKDQS